jgi:hypothetical protein
MTSTTRATSQLATRVKYSLLNNVLWNFTTRQAKEVLQLMICDGNDVVGLSEVVLIQIQKQRSSKLCFAMTDRISKKG